MAAPAAASDSAPKDVASKGETLPWRSTERQRRPTKASPVHALPATNIDYQPAALPATSPAATDLKMATSEELATRFVMNLGQSTVVRFTDTANDILLEGSVARAVSEVHWLEEWAVLSEARVLFYTSRVRKRKQPPSLTIYLTELLAVERVEADSAPVPEMAMISLATVGRIYYYCVGDDEQRTRWIDALKAQISQVRASSAWLGGIKGNEALTHPAAAAALDASASLSMETSDPSVAFLDNSPRWKCGKRRILNCRRILPLRMAQPPPDPCAAVAQALRMSFEPTAALSDGGDDEGLIHFLDATCELRHCSVRALSEAQQLCFHLNLYHLMTQHAYLVLGPPASPQQRLSLHSVVAYQTADDIFSLAELEHCIIRAAMSPPSSLPSKFSPPKSRFACALTRRDWRIDFALNSGSLSAPVSVPIYTPADVHHQLDLTAAAYLSQSVQVHPLA